MQNPQRSFSGRRTTGTKTDTLPRTVRSWIFLIIMRARPASKPGEGATAVTGAELCERLFQSTPPRGGRHRCSRWARPPTPYFNPRPPRGGRQRPSTTAMRPLVFQSTPPARGATSSLPARCDGGDISSTPPARGATRAVLQLFPPVVYFNPRPPRGGRPRLSPRLLRSRRISIHAPREGGDSVVKDSAKTYADFNPRPPRGGRLTRADT